MLASTNIYTFKHTHTHKHKHANTHPDWARSTDPYCTVFTNEQREARFMNINTIPNDLKEAPVQLPIKKPSRVSKVKKTSHSPATVGPLLLDSERSWKTFK